MNKRFQNVTSWQLMKIEDGCFKRQLKVVFTTHGFMYVKVQKIAVIDKAKAYEMTLIAHCS